MSKINKKWDDSWQILFWKSSFILKISQLYFENHQTMTLKASQLPWCYFVLPCTSKAHKSVSQIDLFWKSASFILEITFVLKITWLLQQRSADFHCHDNEGQLTSPFPECSKLIKCKIVVRELYFENHLTRTVFSWLLLPWQRR